MILERHRSKRAYYQELDGAALDKDSEEDHGEGGGEEELLVPHTVVQDHGQGEANRPPWIKIHLTFSKLRNQPETPIGNHNFLLPADFVGAELVHNRGKDDRDDEPEFCVSLYCNVCT